MPSLDLHRDSLEDIDSLLMGCRLLRDHMGNALGFLSLGAELGLENLVLLLNLLMYERKQNVLGLCV